MRLVATGVCHTDAIVRDQWYPTPLLAVLGHEGAGIVEKVGSAVTGITPSDRVVSRPSTVVSRPSTSAARCSPVPV